MFKSIHFQLDHVWARGRVPDGGGDGQGPPWLAALPRRHVRGRSCRGLNQVDQIVVDSYIFHLYLYLYLYLLLCLIVMCVAGAVGVSGPR